MLTTVLLLAVLAWTGVAQPMPAGNAAFGPNIQWLNSDMPEKETTQLSLDVMRHLPGAYNADVANYITCMCNKNDNATAAAFLEESEPVYDVRKGLDSVKVPHALATRLMGETREQRTAADMKKRRESMRESKS